MISALRKIRQNLLAQGLFIQCVTYALTEIMLVIKSIHSPVRDGIWVEKKIVANTHGAVRYGIWVERTNVPQTNRAVRYGIWVERKIVANTHRAVRYGIWNLREGIENHMTYLTARCNRFIHRFLPIYSPYGTAKGFNDRIENDLAC